MIKEGGSGFKKLGFGSATLMPKEEFILVS